MFTKRTIAACFIAFFGSAVLAQSGDQIVSLMNSGEFEAARKMSLSLVKKNDPVAFYTLGHLDYRKNTPEGYKSAFQYLLKAAKLNHLSSMDRVGYMYLSGIGINKDFSEAENWLSKAADKGSDVAIYDLGRHFYGDYGGEQKPELALEQFLKILNRKDLEQTEKWIISGFYSGLLTVNSTDQRGKEFSEMVFSEVLKSKLTTESVNWAKKEIAILVEKNLTRAGQGDGTEDDKLCQNFGFQVLSIEYSQCRLKVELAKREANDRQRAFDMAKRQYDEELARYEQQKAELEREIERARQRRQGEAMLKFGLALLGGTSPHLSENLANAGRQSLGLPPVVPNRPTFQDFTITGPDLRTTHCNVFGDKITCR